MMIKIRHGNRQREIPYRGYIRQRIKESLVARLFGEEQLETMCRGTIGYRWPLPIANTRVSLYDGMLVPTVEGAGFASLSDLISEYTGGKAQAYPFNKVGPTGAVGVSSSVWRLGNVPSAGAMGAALAGGTDCTRTTTGALGQNNAAGGDTLHLLSAEASASVGANTLLLYDRIWHGAPAMNSSGNQTVTMTAGRYASTGASGASRGNTAWMEVGGTALAATGHNHTLQYVDDQGNAAENAAAFAGVSGAIVDRFDHSGFLWPLNAGDVGISDITQYTCSAAVATGVMNLVLAHPLAMIPTRVANIGEVYNFINDMFQPVQILDNACLALAEVSKGATTGTTYSGLLNLGSG